MKKILHCICLSIFTLSAIFAKTDYNQELKRAIDKKDSTKITKLLKKCSENDKSDALIYATIYENKDIVTLLLDSGVNINSGNRVHPSPLVAALTNYQNRQLPNLFLKRGANIDIKINLQEESLLHYALTQKDSELFEWLLDNGINVCAETINQETALDYSVKQNLIKETKKLLDYNVIKIKDDSLFYAIKNGYSEIIQLLFSSKYRESLSKKDSLVISAIKENQTAILSILLENDCTPNAKDENQNSALYISAIKNQDYESSSVLIKFGANVNEINGGKSLLYKARTHKTPNEKITELLISSGAKLTVNEEKDLKYERYSPKNMNRLKRENIFKYDQKINGKIFWIEGRVAGTRNAFLADEYIIKIEDAEENPFGDRDSVDVVIPKYISEKTLEKLSKLEQGSVVSLLVKGRSYTSYVDIVLTDE